MWRKTMVYLGLVDDDEYDEYEPYDETGTGAGRRLGPAPMIEPEPLASSSAIRTLPQPDTGITMQPRTSAVVRPIAPPIQSPKVHILAPNSFNDAQEIGDKLKSSQPIIVNLQAVDRDLSRRLIDFASGLAYGIGAQMERVADQVFLLTPSNMEVSAEEKRRLQERGLIRT